MAITMMTTEQEGAYIRLICYDWSNDGIPDDDEQLSKLSRLGEGWFKGGSTVVRKCFNQHPTKAGFLTNDRLEKEREKQKIWKEKSSEGGRKSAEARKNKGKSDNKTNLKGGSTTLPRVVQPNGNTISSSISSSINNIERERVAEKPTVRRPTIEQAKSAASTIGITEDKAVEWWNAREASEWMKGMAGGGTSPVGTNWQADMTTYAKRGGYGSGNSNSKPDHRATKKENEFQEKITIKQL